MPPIAVINAKFLAWFHEWVQAHTHKPPTFGDTAEAAWLEGQHQAFERAAEMAREWIASSEAKPHLMALAEAIEKEAAK